MLKQLKNRHDPYLRIGLYTCVPRQDKMGVGPMSSFFFIFLLGILQNTKKYKYMYKKTNKIPFIVPKIPAAKLKQNNEINCK